MANVLPHNAPQGFEWVTRLEGWQLDGNEVRVTARTMTGAQAVLTFQALTPAIWHFTFVPPDTQADPPTPIVIMDKTPGVALSVEQTEAGIVVRGPALSLVIDRDPWMLRWLDADGRDIARENPSDIDGLGRPFVLPLGYVRGADGVTTVTESLHLRPDEHLFGLGEKFTPLDKVQQRIVTWTQDAFGSTSERSHKNIPFLISTRGYGLLLDTGARVTWDLGNVSCQSYTMTLDAPALDGYLIYGPTPAEILDHYTALTGRAPLPPKWSFGLWMSGAGTYRDRAAIEALVAGLDEHDIPADVIHVDTWWLRWRQYCDFRWDEDAFPDVKGFTDALHAQGYHLTVWEHPYISVESDLFEVGQREGYFLTRPDGSVYVIDYGLSLAPRPDGTVRVATPETSWNAPVAIIDMTNPDAVRWFQDLHRPAIASGIDAFKTDFGEDIPEDAVFFNGQTGRTMHNLYPLLYNQAVTEVTRQERGYDLVWARSGTAGSQRFPVCWSGDPAADFDSLACTVRGGLSIGLSGVPFWSHDIGGYRGMPSPRLFVRWAQFGLMCSHSRMHGDSPREPWYFGPETTEIVRRYVKLRYALFPYLYSLAHEAHRTGLPVIRAMPLAFPGDPNAVGKDLQYMLGPSVLVAPVVNESDTRSVYLPAGTWIDYWTGKRLDGPANITVDAPLDTLPLFVRGGAVIPIMGPVTRIPEGRIDPLIVAVYPHGNSTYTLLEDDGETALRYVEHDGARILTLHGEQPRAVIVRPVGLGPLSDVRAVVNGQPVEIELHLHQDGIEFRLEGVREAEIRL